MSCTEQIVSNSTLYFYRLVDKAAFFILNESGIAILDFLLHCLHSESNTFSAFHRSEIITTAAHEGHRERFCRKKIRYFPYGFWPQTADLQCMGRSHGRRLEKSRKIAGFNYQKKTEPEAVLNPKDLFSGQ